MYHSQYPILIWRFISSYQQTLSGKPGDIGSDGIWELWRLEGPGFAWHYRGNPLGAPVQLAIWAAVAE